MAKAWIGKSGLLTRMHPGEEDVVSLLSERHGRGCREGTLVWLQEGKILAEA